MALTIRPKKLKGYLEIPPSKSLTHRAIICASLASGTSLIERIDHSDDIDATIDVMQALGAKITDEGNHLIIKGGLKSGGLTRLDCRESASTLRFVMPLALVYRSKTYLKTRGTLQKRPLEVYYELFDQRGIKYHLDREIAVEGTLKAGTYHLPGHVSSQFISGLLMALPLLPENSRIIMTTPLESFAYVDLTLHICRSFGVEITYHEWGFDIPGGQSYQACDYRVEGDFSQAAYYLVADVLGSEIEIGGLDLSSPQGDSLIIDFLSHMGATLVKTKRGIMMQAEQLKAIDVDACICPDLMPPLALAMARGEGTSHILHAKRLRFKESDRLQAICSLLKRAGITVLQEEDSCTIVGGQAFQGGSFSVAHDHRIAMMAAIMGAHSIKDVVIDDAQCVRKSYPGFFADFHRLGGETYECELGTTD